MTIYEKLKKVVLSILGFVRLNGNPNNERLTFISDAEAIRISNIRTNRYWYIGDGNELLNWYTNQQTYGYAENPIYNRNKRNMFWAQSVNENLKRVHCGVPKAMIDMMCDVVGYPKIESSVAKKELNEILEVNDFSFILPHKCRPLTLVEGDGAFKINVVPKLSSVPMIEYYGAEDWRPIYKSNILVGMCFLSYYNGKGNKKYVLFEMRIKDGVDLHIKYKLYRLEKANEIIECAMEEVPEIAEIKDQIIPNANCLLAIPNRYYYDPLNKDRGKSVFDSKVDLFDMLDEIMTQASQTNRVSTPVEYYPVDLLRRGKNGETTLPSKYNREYVKVDSLVDGDGNYSAKIETTQPNLYFDKYSQLFTDTMKTTLLGFCSPASLGMDVSKRDNAEAQREKEKQTLFTRKNIADSETKTIVKLCNMLLLAYNYIKKGEIVDVDYGISVKFEEFANPSFESEITILGPAWNSGQISTERFVTMLWGSKLSEEEMRKEIEWLDTHRSVEDNYLEALTNHETELRDSKDLSSEEETQEEPVATEE